jgi:ubiquinone/menaquinone biosynthesis C-methylase UbiE
MNISAQLICPKCKGNFQIKETKLLCNQCHIEGTFDNNIYDFLGDNAYYWSEITSAETEDFLHTAKLEGWRTALSSLNSTHPELGQYISSEGRADWLFHCVDFSRAGSCLDIGSGWGTITFTLSKFFHEVWSLEAVKPRIEFQKIRQQQEKIDNLQFVRSDWLSLPFPDNYFDVVSANGVLEWIGLSDYSKNPRQLQLAFLAEVKRVLKPGGCLYIGIENRFGWNYFLGGMDHSGLRFTSLLPRIFSDMAIRLSKHAGEYRSHSKTGNWPDYRTYTYSKWGYRDLLKTVGFDNSEFYWTTSYNEPQVAGKLHNGSFILFLRFLLSRGGIINWMTSSLAALISLLSPRVLDPFVSLLIPEFLIFAYKPPEKDKTSFESKLLRLDTPCSSFFRISGSKDTDSIISYFIFRNGKYHSVLKFMRPGSSPSSRIVNKLNQFNHINISQQVIDSIPVYIEPVSSQ